MKTPPEIATVVATLRTVAGWMPEDQRQTLYEVADQTEATWDDLCCPVCEEVTCDDGCPLQHVRAALRDDR
jgi:hypothetical protein